MMIRVLSESDAQIYRTIRLHALRLSPEAFGSTYEREAEFSLDTFEDRVRPAADKFVLGAFDDTGSLVGVVTFMQEAGRKDAHKGNVYGMYVAPDMRGKGLGKALLIELIRRARNLEGLERLKLTVVSENTVAKKLYQSLGFETYGVERAALKHEGMYYDEDLMVLQL
jgi:RimJ/RimL family protein N-acetyltransferase